MTPPTPPTPTPTPPSHPPTSRFPTHPPIASSPTGLARFNALSADEAKAALHSFCGSHRWAEAVAAKRPFRIVEDLHAEAERTWMAMGREDWLEAFSHHPRIGERDLSQARFAATATQSGREQSGMNAATEEQRAEFVAGNAEYERKFGHIFLICASGRSASEMLASLRARLSNDPAAELRSAAAEQARITRIRMERWLTK